MGTRLENVQREFASYKNYVVLEKKFARVYTPPFNARIFSTTQFKMKQRL